MVSWRKNEERHFIYHTALCGRMHFVGPDQRHGFMKRLVGDITPTTVKKGWQKEGVAEEAPVPMVASKVQISFGK